MAIGSAAERTAQRSLWTRAQNEVGGRFELIAAMLSALPVVSCTIDGEAIVRRADGHSDFHALR